MSAFIEEDQIKEEVVPPFVSIQEPPRQIVRKRTITVDFTTTTFSGLVPLNEINREDIFGPIAESNWVVPGKLIAGAFPGYTDDIENTNSLIKILNCGVTKFVCMQEEYNVAIKEEDWRKNCYGKTSVVRPYFADVQRIMENKVIHPTLSTDVFNVTFEHCPIKDCSTVADDIVFSLAKDLVKAIHDGEVVYLHCWGGHGRTGIMVCLMLHLMYGLTANEALERCQFLHDIRKMPIIVSSPQTFRQKDQVRRIIYKSLTDKGLFN
uniref:Tyrosine specific protein phosphatases domain-containing protein n=1 Tax=viral metagenome TaxID=1070528 RepID=A0A6C0F341_9ZZZZ